MKIAIMGHKGIPMTYGGVEKHVQELACGLAKKKGYQVYSYARSYYTPKRLKKYKGVNIIHLPSIRTKHLDAITHTFLASWHAILVLRADVIHYQGIGPAFCALIPKIFSPRTKVVLTFHCCDYLHKKWGKFARFSLHMGEIIGCLIVDEIIPTDGEVERHIRERYDRETSFIPHGIILNEKVSAKIITKKWNLKKNDYILVVSRLVRHKGIHYLIKAYNRLNTNKKLVITGPAFFTEDYEKEIREMAKDNKNIIFTGRQSGRALAELFSNAYIFVHPSEFEGFPLNLMDAVSYSTAALLSDIPVHRKSFGNLPYLFKNKNVKDLERKLKYVLAHPQEVKARAKAIRRYGEKHYNWAEVVEKTTLRYV